MSLSESKNGLKENKENKMENKDWKFEKLSSGIGWGLFFILIGALFFAQIKGWLQGDWWTYFAIGLGGILVIGFLMRYFSDLGSRWGAVGRLVVGLELIYIGLASIYGFGDWWPLALVAIGIGFLVKALWGNRNESYSH